MTYTPSQTGMVAVSDSARILRVVFPNYPDLQPCKPAPTLEPICAVYVRANPPQMVVASVVDDSHKLQALNFNPQTC